MIALKIQYFVWKIGHLRRLIQNDFIWDFIDNFYFKIFLSNFYILLFLLFGKHFAIKTLTILFLVNKNLYFLLVTRYSILKYDLDMPMVLSICQLAQEMLESCRFFWNSLKKNSKPKSVTRFYVSTASRRYFFFVLLTGARKNLMWIDRSYPPFWFHFWRRHLRSVLTDVL